MIEITYTTILGFHMLLNIINKKLDINNRIDYINL